MATTKKANGSATSEKAATKKAAEKPKPAVTKKVSTAPDEYMRAKLAAQRKLKLGATMTYHGHKHPKLTGKKVRVEKFEGRGGVFIKAGDKSLVVSPFALLNGTGKEAKR